MEYYINKLFCCFKIKSKYQAVNNNEDNYLEYKLLEDIEKNETNILKNKLKYLNYLFIFEIDDNSFLCKNIDILPNQYNDGLKLSYISRQNRRKKDFLTIIGNENLKCYEFNCIKGDYIKLKFNLSFNIKITIINYKSIKEYYITNQNEILIEDINNLLHIYWKYIENDKIFIDSLNQSNVWFSNFNVEDENIIGIDYAYDINYGLLLGIIKPLLNPVTIN